MMNLRDNYKTALFLTVFPSVLCAVLKWRGFQFNGCGAVLSVFFSAAVLCLVFPKFGNQLHKYISKAEKAAANTIIRIILFFVWICAVLPSGLIMKAAGRDRLRLKKIDTSSFWIDSSRETDYEYQF